MKLIYFPFFDHHIANSPYTAGELRAAAQGQLVPRGVWIRPMGVDARHLSPARRSAEARNRVLEMVAAGDGSVVLLYVGRLVPEKNLALLFDLLARLARDAKRDYRLLVVGDGIERGKWEEFSRREAPGRVTFAGHVGDKNQLAEIFANADIFIHPNPREPFGIAPLEAMASGLPLVAPDSGGVTSYADSTNAWMARPDFESFAAAVEAALSDDAARNDRVQAALAAAERNTWENACAGFLDLYAELHRAAVDPAHALPEPAFSSTPASRLELAWYRGVSQAAEKMFRVISPLLPSTPRRKMSSETV